MARPKKFTKKTLKVAVNRYFRSITRTVAMTERRDTGERDDKGHAIFEDVPVINNLGEQAMITEYIVPPTVGGLCDFLGIHRSTWAEYADPLKYPEFSDTAARAGARMRAWNEEQLLTRSGKDVKGVIFNLENNYGYKERVEMSNDSLENYLRQLAEEGQGGQEF